MLSPILVGVEVGIDGGGSRSPTGGSDRMGIPQPWLLLLFSADGSGS